MKMLLYGSVLIFSTIGGYIPSLWHAGFLSAWGIIGAIFGTIVGIWLALKVNSYIDV
jgi:ABC-type lipoprotein release transport system permease subunit